MKAAGIKAVPYNHPQIDLWRDSLKGGITYVTPSTNLLITGAVDDVWINSNKEFKYYVSQFANFLRTGAKIKKRKLSHWFRLA